MQHHRNLFNKDFWKSGAVKYILKICGSIVKNVLKECLKSNNSNFNNKHSLQIDSNAPGPHIPCSHMKNSDLAFLETFQRRY